MSQVKTAITLRTIVFGGFLRFAVKGDIEAVSMVDHTVGPGYLPTPGFFQLLGNAPTFEVDPKPSNVEVRGPQPGGYSYGHLKTLTTANDMDVKCTLTDWNELALRSVFMLGESPVIGDDAYQPLHQSAPVEGWLQLDSGDQGDNQILNGFLYCEMMVAALQGAEKKTDYQMQFKVRKNVLATVGFPAAV